MQRIRRLPIRRALAIAAAGVAVFGTSVVAERFVTAGPQGDGTGVTSYGWTVTPAGRNIDLVDRTWWADRPYDQALSPDGKTMLVVSGGPSTESVKVVTTATGKDVATGRTPKLVAKPELRDWCLGPRPSA